MCLSFRRIRQPEQEEHRPWIMCPVATLPQGRSNNMAIRNFVRRKLAWILPEERSTNLEVENENLRSRSEEHTSELQSLMRISYAVFCLKKKNKKQTTRNTTIITRTHTKT